MSITPAHFIQRHTGTPIFIPGMSTAECVALFWAFNREVNKGEAYSAVGAVNLWQQPGTTPYVWDTYDRIPVGSGQPGDWGIWAGDHGAYPNGGHGHVAYLIRDNGNGTGQFFSQNPNAPAILTLSYNGTVGYLRPKGIQFDYGQGAGATVIRFVTSPANVRVAPNANAPLAPGYPDGLAVGAKLAVVGYVQGQDVNGKGDDAWYKTVSGYYVWANNAGNDISGLPFLKG